MAYIVRDHIEGGSPAATKRYFMINNFQYPAPGTDWTPKKEGAGLAASKTAKTIWIPFEMLKIADEIISFKVTGTVVSGGNTVTLDAEMYKVAKAGTVTNITGGGMTQVSKTANYTMDEETTLTTLETVATDYMYGIEIAGTTAATTSIELIGVELRFNRKG